MDHFEFVHKMTKSALDHVKEQPPQMLADGGDIVHASNTPNGSLDTQLNGPQTIASGNAGNPNQGLLGGIGGLLGLNNTFQPTAININPGTNQAQLNQAYNGTQTALGQNQGIANTLNPGIASGANTEDILAGQLANQANGIGPNPAQAELNQATGQNIAQTAALLAGQRGAGGNAGLIGEQAARMGAGTQQQAVGQGATLQAQQQIAAQQQAANLAATRINQGQNAAQGISQQQQNEQNILQGANTGANNAAVSAQGSLNNTNAQIASGNTQSRAGLFGGIASGISSALPMVGALFAHGGLVRMDKGGNVLDQEHRDKIPTDNFALPGRRYPIHDVSHARNALARVSQYGTSSEKKRVKEAVSKKYPEIQMKAEGGRVEKAVGNDDSASKCTTLRPNTGWGAIIQCDADGGPIIGNPLAGSGGIQPQSFVGQWLNSNIPTGGAQPSITNGPEMGESPDLSEPLGDLGSSIHDFHPSSSNGSGAETGGAGASISADSARPAMMPFEKGGKVSGKAKVNHDSLNNDVVPADVAGGGKAMLTPGELIVDLDTMKDPGPIGKMARALAKHIESKKNKHA